MTWCVPVYLEQVTFEYILIDFLEANLVSDDKCWGCVTLYNQIKKCRFSGKFVANQLFFNCLMRSSY